LSGDGTADFPLFHHQDPQDACSQNPGVCFSEVAEAPQAAATQTHPAGSFWKWFCLVMEQLFPRCSIIVW